MASMKYNNVYINDVFSIAGPLEKEGMIPKFNMVMDDYYFGEKTFENAEVKMQKTIIENLLKQNKLKDTNIDLVVGGELSNQIATTSYNMRNFNIPFLGVYSACAIYVQSLIILANMIESKYINTGIALTSSHSQVSEKQFRFPVEYGSPKPDYTTFTATCAVGNIVSKTASNIKIESATIGRVMDYGITDVFNMGAIMVPAAAEVLNRHLSDMKRKIEYYDLILTGDLGEVGRELFKKTVKKQYNLELGKYMDCGSEIYREDQPTFSGASGPVALPLVLWNKVLKDKKIKKVLLIATGALHSPIMVNQKNTIPSIAHVVSLEVS